MWGILVESNSFSVLLIYSENWVGNIIGAASWNGEVKSTFPALQRKRSEKIVQKIFFMLIQA